MAGIINTGSAPRLLEKTIHKAFVDTLQEHSPEYSQIFNVLSSNHNFERDVQLDGFGYATEKAQGGSIDYDSAGQGFVPTYTHTEYAKGFVITEIMQEDNQYDLMGKMTRALAESVRKTREQVCANVLNRASNDSYTMTGGDGVGLLSTAHILGPNNSSTYSNELATPANLSEAALEDIFIQIDQAVDARNLPAAIKPTKLVVPPALRFEAERILKSSLQPGTANNDVNAIVSNNALPGGYMVNHYLTSNTAWFVLTDCNEGLQFFNRRDIRLNKDMDFNTSNMRFKADMRFSAGWTNPRGVYGSVGV